MVCVAESEEEVVSREAVKEGCRILNDVWQVKTLEEEWNESFESRSGTLITMRWWVKFLVWKQAKWSVNF
jgi:hypothetical protein